MCIRMIPPDDVSFGTTSTTQASPITTEQCTTSSCQATMTTPEEETPETSAAPVTMAPTLCTTCDIAAIAPVMEANTVFENTNTVGTDGCTQTNAICRRTDDQVCTGVTLSATNAAGTSTISSAMNANQVSGLLTCQADACSTCNIEAARPVMDPPNTVFQIMDNTPAGQTCKVYSVACLHQTQQCTVVLYATMSTGSEEMLSSDIL
ncbi:hypothetical protein GCK72_021438 [Caenorhabditis remanei]|uniref:DUF281 domain-containing protein n=1 Tax=Caenorhabditis remanei TaxID=31234 RepID=A0A6A5GJK2_CAERE|nr:hypothetical protein GCK72_021438 [Caenorhabditis remanei]KAF1754873.1 hypothetical protein GCK72_021438 [Caenorhabditis remanei]